MKKLQIFLADDHTVIREGLKRLIDSEPDMVVVGEAGQGEEAVSLIVALRPHVVVLDLTMPVLSGLAVARRLRERCPSAKILVLTVREDPENLRELKTAGVPGYLLKRAAAEELIRAIRTVAAGGIHVDPRLTGPAESAPTAEGETGAGTEKLSARERSVLQLIAQGYSNKEIAARMNLSVKTIETYKARSMDKLGLRSRVDIVRHANKLGWLQED